ncbi:hypothetical protein EV198_3633 [Roseivirga ehrenbergii]|uniref:Uncharacterized protein n=1 Tax=Roseivirga ehrenbergii (strain DSM 102268 / JCM 13514 / KCTC 12282 / NCIMB 14502 / KMM 6017) TaxID=279360 RepID=A0A150XK63_ROSEK|nr:hypothetical protein [Roseivirga ehrenbergii]KYG79100.1 hypothetical protein MB14_17485 [Roseivirga ehrenbergii]TCK99102.1 hypothetical protein EV198_3633 [Roseivirga ehrenbergii]
MKVKRNIKQLSTVELLFELDNKRSSYPKEEIDNEIKNRNLTEAELKKAFTEKQFVTRIRSEKVNQSMTIAQMILLFIFPIGIESHNNDGGPELSSWETKDGFYRSGGYEKIAKQRFIIKLSSLLFWTIIAIAAAWYLGNR